MKFTEFTYKRPDVSQIQAQMTDAIERFQNATNAQTQLDIVHEINAIRSHFSSMGSIAGIRYSIDTNNAQYEEEQSFFDDNGPLLGDVTTKFYQALMDSVFINELQEQLGKHFFDIASISVRTFDPCIIEELKRENHLSSEYTKLLASAKIMFEGEERNLSNMVPFEMSPDRTMRQRAATTKWEFLASKQTELDHIYDELVKVRHTMSQKLGFENFTELGYLRMLRVDYNASMVADYRQQVLETVTPLAAELRRRQSHLIGIDHLKFYDLNAHFKSGNPKPKGDPEWILANGKQMYRELSTETAEFFDFMVNNELMDLLTRKGKAGGGYCTFIEDYKAPFIFSNFNGTADDINVLTHEAGHAFQVYMSRDLSMPEYYWPSAEAAEIHSMSMEFLAWPWMNRFFGEDVDKFKYEHLSGAILFLPYGVSVDEFQHYVYANPSASPEERRQMWRKIEQKYMPWIDYDGNEYLENGGFWQKQAHIFMSPFYYIDYTLAQICAFQFWQRANQDRQKALNDYIRLCKVGGSKPFLQLVEYAELESPFNKNCLQKVVQPVAKYLQSISDDALR